MFGLTLWNGVWCCAAVYLITCGMRAYYYCCFHSLSNIPGPWIRGAFFFPFFWEIWTGEIAQWTMLHEKYGEIVRVSPTCVSVINPGAWQDIYGSSMKTTIPKDPDVYGSSSGEVTHIINASDKDHARMRKSLSYAFSEQALKEQEGLITAHIDLMIKKLHARAGSATPIDLMRWLNYATFDILGDLCFGESFEALENENYNDWIVNIFKGLKFARMFRVFRAYPLIGVPILSLLRLFPQLAKARQRHEQYTVNKTARRLDSETDRKDMMSYILKQTDEKGMTRQEILKTSGYLIIAGSETSATLLSGAFFFLLENPDWFKRVQSEVVSCFTDQSTMSFAALSQLPQLNAVIQETFRMYPPVPTILPRLVGHQGAMICGKFIPPNTSVGVAQYPAYRTSLNFKDPDLFAPERFLGEARYRHDNRSILQPFSVGPRNCVGKSLAMAEVRLILARLVWHFDMKLDNESVAWNQQKIFILWDKPALKVKISQREMHL